MWCRWFLMVTCCIAMSYCFRINARPLLDIILQPTISREAQEAAYMEEIRKHCPCPRDYPLKVCGTDGRTYDSDCQVTCTKWLFEPYLQTASIGPCPDPKIQFNGTKPCHCGSTAEGWRMHPVCAVDDGRAHTFDSLCQMVCNKATKAPNMTLLHNGACTYDELVNPRIKSKQ